MPLWLRGAHFGCAACPAGRYAAHGEPLRGTRIRYPPKALFMEPSRGGVEVNVDVPVEKRRRERDWRLVAAAATVAGQPCNNPRLWR